MQITHNNMIPGILSKGIEFFGVSKNVVKAIYNGSKHDFDKLPEFVYEIIRREMKDLTADLDTMQAFTFRRWGGLDHVPDIDEHGNVSEPEYVPMFNTAYFETGREISEAQMRVLKLIQCENKVIAEFTFTSPHTVARHIQDMLSNSGFNNRTELAHWATKKGII